MKDVFSMMVALTLSVGCGESPAEPSATREPASEATEASETETTEARGEPAAPDEAAEPNEAPTEATSATVGRPAPDFTLTDQAGTEHRLSQYRGKVVVLEWINPRCPFVQRHYEAGTMTGLEQALPDDRVVWLAVDSSNFVRPEQSEAWRAEHSMAYPVLQDPAGTVGRRYDARTTPHMYVIDAEGTLRYAGAIDDDPRGRSEAPTNHVRRAVEALLAGADVPMQTTEPYGCTVKYEGV